MSIGDKERLERLSNELIGKDWFMTFPDFDAYVKTRERPMLIMKIDMIGLRRCL